MTNTEIIARHLQSSLKTKEYEGECKICGKDIKKGIPEKKILSANFTNYSECKAIESKMICIECGTCMKEVNLRYKNFVADKNNLYLLGKNDLEEYLFNLDKYVSGLFVIGITTSFKKHNSF